MHYFVKWHPFRLINISGMLLIRQCESHIKKFLLPIQAECKKAMMVYEHFQGNAYFLFI
jgi:hypothetical protein